MRSLSAPLLLSAMLAVCSVSPAAGQGWGDILKEKAAQRAVNAAESAVEQGLDATEDAVRCVVTDQACIEKAQQKGKTRARTPSTRRRGRSRGP